MVSLSCFLGPTLYQTANCVTLFTWSLKFTVLLEDFPQKSLLPKLSFSNVSSVADCRAEDSSNTDISRVQVCVHVNSHKSGESH